MQADTSMKLNVKGNANTNEIAEVIRKALQSKATDDIETEAVNTFCDDMNISNNQVSVECGWSITSWEFEYLREAVIAIAKETDCEFTFNAEHYSLNCGYEAYIEAEYTNGVLTYKNIGSENLMGCCPECGEDVVYYTEYDPSKTYICPECGESLTEEELFPFGVPTWEIEEIKIR